MRVSGPRRVVYPTGLVVQQWAITSKRGRLSLKIEKTLSLGSKGLWGHVGEIYLEGSYIPPGAKGALCHETLPVIRFGSVDAALARARVWDKELK